MMRAREILQEYEKDRRDFRGVNLRGLSFKGKDLSGADFSGADIRGTNFRWANLTGAKFCGAKAGLQKRQVAVLLAAILVLVGLSALLNVLVSVFISLNFQNTIADWVSLIPVIFFWIVFIYQGIENSTGDVAVPFAVTVIFVAAFLSTIDRTKFITSGGAFAAAAGIPFTFAGAFAGAVAVLGPVTGAIVFIFAFTGAVAFIFLFAIAFDFNGVVAGVVTLCQTLLSFYLAYLVMAGDEKYATIRNRVVVCAAIGGTSFRDANLTDTDFTNATLKSTDFRGANITRTCWRNTIKLDRIRPGETYLEDAKIRELVRTGEGQDKDFNRLDFRGINLKEANLQDANFIGTNLNRANLQNANLSGAKLVQTLLEGADLTGATLTGACVEDWGISNTTKLIEIHCNYIFLKYPELERRPAVREKNFEPGEFAKLAQKIPNTVDLIFKDGIDWQTFLKTFQELRVESETEELPVIQTIENKGDGAFVIRVKVPDKIDKAKYERKFWQKYKPMLELKDERIKLLSEQKDFYSEEIKNIRKENTRLIGVFETMAEKEDQESKIYVQENYGVVGKEAENSGVVGKEVENSGVVGKEAEIKYSNIARNIYEAQQKTLAETAAEIQQLLKQLEQSNPTETKAGQMTVAAQAIEIIENKPTLKQRIIGVLKSAGTEALKEAIDNPIANILVAGLEGWIEP